MGIKKFLIIMSILFFNLSFSAYSEESWPYKIYRGNFHVHTSLSEKARHYGSLGKIDTIGSPMENFDHTLASSPSETCRIAREIGLDGIGISDHDCALSGKDWLALKQTSRNESKDNFFCLSGFEWTPPDYNHVNVFGSEDFVSACAKFITYGLIGIDRKIQKASEWKDFINWLCVEAENNPYLICQFNHPADAEGNFNDFRTNDVNKIAVELFSLIEVRSGPAVRFTSVNDNEKYYQRAIQNGWWVAPSIGVDNFGNLTKGGARKCHTALWVEKNAGDLRKSVLSAMLQRKTFASEDDNFILKYWAKLEDDDSCYYLGDRININRGQKLVLSIDLFDPDETIGKIQLVTIKKSGVLVNDFNPKMPAVLQKNFKYTLGKIPDTDTLAYYVKIIQNDGDIIISSPIKTEVAIPEVQSSSSYYLNKDDPLYELMRTEDFQFRVIVCDSYETDGKGELESYDEKNVFHFGKKKIHIFPKCENLDKIYEYPCIVKIIIFDPSGKVVEVSKTKLFGNESMKKPKIVTEGKFTVLGEYTVEGYVNNDLHDRRNFKLIK